MTMILAPCDGCGLLETNIDLWSHPVFAFFVYCIVFLVWIRCYKKIKNVIR